MCTSWHTDRYIGSLFWVDEPVPMIPLDSGTGTFVEIMVLVGENRMRCQSQSVKLTLALHKGRMAFDSFFKGRVV